MRPLLAPAFALLALSASDAAAQTCEQPDVFEPNDGCAAAAPLGAGAHLGLTVQGPAAPSGTDEDHYAVTLVAGDALLVDALFSGAAGDVDLELYGDAACSQLVDASYSQSDDETVTFVNSGATPRDLVLVVKGFGAGFDCNEYDLLVSLGPDPCAALPDDPTEDDDDCASASLLFGGALQSRNVSKDDPDWYRVELDAGATMIVELRFTHDDGDLDLRLWGLCPTAGALPLTSSESETDLESVGVTNTDPNPIDVWLEVYVWSGSDSDCNEYDFELHLSGGEPGTPMCFGDGTTAPGCPCGNTGSSGAGCANSTGLGGRLVPSGTSVFVNDDLVLTIEDAVPSQAALVLQGGSIVTLPFRDGVLCMGPPTERLEFLALDTAGSAATTVSILTEGAVPGPGATTWYQAWYRDPGGASPCGTGSNLTNGLRIDWN